MGVELALTPDGRWGVTVADLVAATRDAGFVALGLSAAMGTLEARTALSDAGLRCHELLALSVSRHEEITLSRAAALAEAASVVGAEWVLTVFRQGLNNETADLIARSAALFAEAGARMAVEFSPMGPISSIPSAIEVVAAAGPDRAGVMIDSWHFCLGDSTWADLETIPLEQIAYVQFDDALAPESDDLMDETMNRRAMPGEGVLELDRFATTLLERGWDGVVSVEVLSDDLRRLSVREFAARAHETTSRYWN